jgi:hypothetical protein
MEFTCFCACSIEIFYIRGIFCSNDLFRFNGANPLPADLSEDTFVLVKMTGAAHKLHEEKWQGTTAFMSVRGRL